MSTSVSGSVALLVALTACAERATETTETTEAVASAATAAVSEDGLGPRLYKVRCAACHGREGRGDGPAAAALQPPPRNFREATFWRGKTLEAIAAVVRDGRPGTVMQAFGGVLSESEIEAVAAHVSRFDPGRGTTVAGGGDGETPGAGPGEDPSGAAPGP